MKTYKQFHGDIEISEIGRELRKIAKQEKESFKILTGYGSTSGVSQSRISAIKSLRKMKKEGLISAFFPGEVRHQLLESTSPYYDAKIKYGEKVKQDIDFGNEGIIFIFIERKS